MISFEGGGRRLTARLIAGEFIRYRSRFPAEFGCRAEVLAGPFTEAVRRVSLVAERASPVRLAFGSGVVMVEAQAEGRARAVETVAADFEGDEPVISFNPHYLLDGLGAVAVEATARAVAPPGDGNSEAASASSGRIRIEFTSPAKPALITWANDAKPAAGEQNGSADGERPDPADGGRPDPADGGRPDPADGGRPDPADGGRPDPADGGRPDPADGGGRTRRTVGGRTRRTVGGRTRRTVGGRTRRTVFQGPRGAVPAFRRSATSWSRSGFRPGPESSGGLDQRGDDQERPRRQRRLSRPRMTPRATRKIASLPGNGKIRSMGIHMISSQTSKAASSTGRNRGPPSYPRW